MPPIRYSVHETRSVSASHTIRDLLRPIIRPRHIVICVHGTFAQSDFDLGPAWWQLKSAFTTWLSTVLNTHCEIEIIPFHWTAANRETDRQQAAMSLLCDYLRPLEDKGQPYHLIGHSHGGSVIWNALTVATLNGKTLAYLRTWSTVGTPFIRYRARALSFAMRLLMSFAAVGAVALYLYWILYFISRLEAVASRWPSLQSYVPCIVAVIWSIWCADLSANILADLYKYRDVERTTWARYGARWLGLWSREDEAIAGLRRAKGANLKVFRALRSRPMRQHPGYVLYSQSRPFFLKSYEPNLGSADGRDVANILAIFSPSTWARLMWNYIGPAVASSMDRYLSNAVHALCHGNDTACYYSADVDPSPIECRELFRHVGLPRRVDAQLIRRANRHFGKMSAAMRTQVAASLDAGVTGFEKIAPDERLFRESLIHTRYFGNRSVCRLLAWHVLNAILPYDGEIQYDDLRFSLRNDERSWYADRSKELRIALIAERKLLRNAERQSRRRIYKVFRLLRKIRTAGDDSLVQQAAIECVSKFRPVGASGPEWLACACAKLGGGSEYTAIQHAIRFRGVLELVERRLGNGVATPVESYARLAASVGGMGIEWRARNRVLSRIGADILELGNWCKDTIGDYAMAAALFRRCRWYGDALGLNQVSAEAIGAMRRMMTEVTDMNTQCQRGRNTIGSLYDNHVRKYGAQRVDVQFLCDWLDWEIRTFELRGATAATVDRSMRGVSRLMEMAASCEDIATIRRMLEAIERWQASGTSPS